MNNVPAHWQISVWPAIVLIGSIVLALVAHAAIFRLGRRLSARTGSIVYHSFLRRAEKPARLILPLAGIIFALPSLLVRSQLVARALTA